MKIQQAAFAKGKAFLKGALHVHTTRSDGKGTPDEVIRLHYENGYHFMALTDHNVVNHVNHADVPMTMLSGIERDLRLPGRAYDKPHCVHVVGVGVPGDPAAPGQDVYPGHAGNGECGADAQPMIDDMHAWGMKTIYAHPEWSGTTWQDFKDLRGNFAMEVWNTGCAMENALDTNAPYWDEALDAGVRIWGVATDDGHPVYQHCQGWVQVAAENDAASILDALEKGEFYASCGPEIKDFYIEDGVAHVECSPAASIQFISLRHPLPCCRMEQEPLTSAECKVPEGLKYVRASVVDEKGRRAWTNPIFLR
ncbi:MAG: CehA/McbA family metallohydrolase [Clostridia bacterium]|nr:CehA/McbA family metallohydrolase [Clostridia bacterium]